MKKKDFLALLLIAAALFAFHFDLFTLKSAFLSGDHRDQQYPWAKFFQQEIRAGRLPWWTSQIHCGFPLLAEGQIGAFYPLNFLFFYFLPIKVAYNYIVLFQYLLGALLFYIYGRRSGLLEWPALFATLIYLFGSTQGGYFYYNYISQKVVIWLPLTLILIDRLREKRKFRDAFFLGVVFAVQIFAGYLQVAVYSLIYSSLYFLFFWFRGKNSKLFFLYSAACALAIFFTLVQLLPTYHLSLLSSRAGTPRGLAYVGSMNPVGFVTLWMPSWDSFAGSEFYLGLLGLFFFFYGMAGTRDPKKRWLLFSAIFFLLLALGKIGGIYAAFVEITKFNAFRTPIKFLFFAAFSAALLAGFGFQEFFNPPENEKAGRASRKLPQILFFVPGFCLAAGIPGLSLFLERCKPKFLPLLIHYVERFIYGKPGHPYSLDYYHAKAQGFYNGMIDFLSLANPYNRNEWLMLIACLGFVIFLICKGRTKPLWKGFCFVILAVDFFFYGFTSIQQNKEPYATIDSPPARSGIVQYLKSDPHLFRVMEVYSGLSESGKYPVFPNSNMIEKIDDIGAYSPLVMRDYARFLEGWGYVNDSLSLRWVQPDIVLKKIQELGFLNVKYLLSLHPLSHPDLAFLMEEKGVKLYRNNRFRERAFFLPGKITLKSLQEIQPEEIRPVQMKRLNEQSLQIEIETREPGLVFISEIHTPEWKAWVNGNPTPVLKAAGLFRAVLAPPGHSEIKMQYAPASYLRLGFAGLLVFAGLLTFVLIKKE